MLDFLKHSQWLCNHEYQPRAVKSRGRVSCLSNQRVALDLGKANQGEPHLCHLE